jgi:hypothetical protein
MKKLLFVLFSITVINLGHGQTKDKSVNTQITTQQFEDGKVDDSRYFIFYFERGDGYCDVKSLTINNVNCSKKTSLSQDGSFWVKPEFSNKGSHGEKFQCKLTKIQSDKFELLIDEPIFPTGKLIHRVILKDNPIQMTEILDYSGVLTKFSNITNKTETVTYKPILKKSYSDWDSIKLGCNTMSVPILKK